jgi:hypothetical protein
LRSRGFPGWITFERNVGEIPEEAGAIAGLERFKQVLLYQSDLAMDDLQLGDRLGGQRENPAAAVVGVPCTLDPIPSGQPVNDVGRGGLVEGCQFTKPSLIDTRPPANDMEHCVLRSSAR